MKNAWIWVVIIVVIVGGVWWYESSQTSAPAAQNVQATNTTPPANTPTDTGAPKTVTVTYDGNTFSPQTLTINKGDTVSFVDSAGPMWVASNPHPVHTGYDGTSRSVHCAAGYTGPKPFDECAAGTSFTFTFDKAGTWGYHDHMNSGAGGTVIVQ